MFAAVVNPACGVPPAFYVNSVHAEEVTAACADVRTITVASFALTLAALIVVQSRYFTSANTSRSTPPAGADKARSSRAPQSSKGVGKDAATSASPSPSPSTGVS